MRGWWGMVCWNGLSAAQQERLLTWGNLPFGYTPEGECPNGAEAEVTTMYDSAPGPRFYCLACLPGYIEQLVTTVTVDSDNTDAKVEP